MNARLDRRHLLSCGLMLVASSLPPLALALPTEPAVMIEFDSLYIPPLFLTGSAAKSADGARRAQAAQDRLQASWPALRARLQAVWPGDGRWRQVLDDVEGHIKRAAGLAARAAWPDAHEALEAVRLDLKKAREARGMDYALDRFTAFHEAMEHLAAAGTGWDAARLTEAQRFELERHFTDARVRWRAVERLALDARSFALTPPREAQLRRAMADEASALSLLSQALRGTDTAALLKAAAATKPPFVRAYTAFGLADGEAPRS